MGAPFSILTKKTSQSPPPAAGPKCESADGVAALPAVVLGLRRRTRDASGEGQDAAAGPDHGGGAVSGHVDDSPHGPRIGGNPGPRPALGRPDNDQRHARPKVGSARDARA